MANETKTPAPVGDTKSQLAAAQKKYDDLAEKTAKLAKDDKKFRSEVDAEVKQKLKARFGDRDALMAQKSAAHSELVAIQGQREGEIVAGVDKGHIKPDVAKAELMALGHTEASADIQLARALKQPASNTAPSPVSLNPTAPLPPRENPPVAQPATAPLKVQDPISAKVPESQTVTYKDPTVKPAAGSPPVKMTFDPISDKAFETKPAGK